MQQVTREGYRVETIQQAGQLAPLHMRDGLAFVFDQSLAWAALIDDATAYKRPGSYRDGDPIAPLLHQLDRDTIDHFSHAAKLLLDGAQAHVGKLPAAMLEGLRHGSDLLLAKAETTGVVLGELVTPDDRLAEIGVLGNPNVYLLVIRQGWVMAAIRMRGSIGLTFLGTVG